MRRGFVGGIGFGGYSAIQRACTCSSRSRLYVPIKHVEVHGLSDLASHVVLYVCGGRRWLCIAACMSSEGVKVAALALTTGLLTGTAPEAE